MRAVVIRNFEGIDSARCEDIDLPSYAPDEVLVRSEAIEVNYADILFFEGKYQNMPVLPFTPGFCAAGRVEAMGAGVKGLSIGQRVLAMPGRGTYAEAFPARAAHCLPVPEGIGPHEAAALGLAYQTAFFAIVERGNFRAGSSVLVLGATGGIGSASIQLAKALGASTVIAVSRSAEGCAMAAALGADHTINSSQDTARALLGSEIPRLTNGAGVDVVIDPVGGELAAAAMRVQSWCGRLVVVGFASGSVPQLPANYLLVKNATACGLQWTDYQDKRPEQVSKAQQTLFALLADGRIKPVLSATLPLEQFPAALGLLKAGQARGRVLLDPGAT